MSAAVTEVYVDLDGVLVDFNAGVYALFNEPNGPEPDAWNGQCAHLNISKNTMWRAIDRAGTAFWRELPETAWCGELLMALRAARLPIAAATSCGRSVGAATGKVEWLIRHGHAELQERLFLCYGPKAALAGPGRLLIDDKPDNVRAWRDAGGLAVVWPRGWNRGAKEPRSDDTRREDALRELQLILGTRGAPEHHRSARERASWRPFDVWQAGGPPVRISQASPRQAAKAFVADNHHLAPCEGGPDPSEPPTPPGSPSLFTCCPLTVTVRDARGHRTEWYVGRAGDGLVALHHGSYAEAADEINRIEAASAAVDRRGAPHVA